MTNESDRPVRQCRLQSCVKVKIQVDFSRAAVPLKHATCSLFLVLLQSENTMAHVLPLPSLSIHPISLGFDGVRRFFVFFSFAFLIMGAVC